MLKKKIERIARLGKLEREEQERKMENAHKEVNKGE